jgi:hypothetical protein
MFSALPSKADILIANFKSALCQQRNLADLIFDHLVGAVEPRLRPRRMTFSPLTRALSSVIALHSADQVMAVFSDAHPDVVVRVLGTDYCEIARFPFQNR